MTDLKSIRKWPKDDRIVAVGLLTARDLALLGERFDRAYPVDSDDGEFAHLLDAIDAADRRRADIAH